MTVFSILSSRNARKGLRQYLLCIGLILPVVVFCAKVLITPVATTEMVPPSGGGFAQPIDSLERGWPWLYYQPQFVVEPNRQFPEWRGDFTGFSLLWFAIDAFVLASVVLGWGLLVRWYCFRSQGRLRFSIIQLFLLVTVTGGICGWIAIHAKVRRTEQDVIGPIKSREFSSYVESSYCPAWLRRFASDESLANVFSHICTAKVDLSKSNICGGTVLLSEDEVERLGNLPYLRQIEFRGNPGSSFRPLRFSTHDLRSLATVEEFHLLDCCDDDTLRSLESHAGLTSIRINVSNGLGFRPHITDAGIERLCRMPSLESLSLSDCGTITDRSCRRFPCAPALKRLQLWNCELTESAAMDLANDHFESVVIKIRSSGEPRR